MTNKQSAENQVCKPEFKRSFTIHENLVLMENKVTSLVLNKPIYVGFCVLDLSKLWMYQFHYNQMRSWFSNIELLMTDTDSLIYRIETEKDIYDVMKENKHYFDFSKFPKNHKLYDDSNKDVLGKYKDELKGLILKEFAGLRPKCYSLLYVKAFNKLAEKITAKGTKKNIKDKYLRHRHFMRVLHNHEKVYVQQNTVRSIKHRISTLNEKRVSLTGFDTKRYIKKDGIKSYAHGHFNCK